MIDFGQILAAVGLTVILKDSRLFSPLNIPLHQTAERLSSWVAQALRCALCLGFWAGAAVQYSTQNPRAAVLSTALGLVGGLITGLLTVVQDWRQAAAWSVLGAVLSFMPGCFIQALIDRTDVVRMALVGFQAAPVCLLVDLLLRRLDD